ncbi:MAG: hypothetical protein IJ496_07010 [Ruminococcus sp.]|nr:hypothetical protein [Ruminococcus sp.]
MEESRFFCPPVRSFPVQIGEITLHIQSYSLSGVRVFSEQGASSGETIVTSCYQRGRRLVLEGTWVTDSEPGVLMLALDQYLRENTSFPLTLRNLCFPDCRLMKYTATEKGCEPAVAVRLELLARIPPEEAVQT